MAGTDSTDIADDAPPEPPVTEAHAQAATATAAAPQDGDEG